MGFFLGIAPNVAFPHTIKLFRKYCFYLYLHFINKRAIIILGRSRNNSPISYYCVPVGSPVSLAFSRLAGFYHYVCYFHTTIEHAPCAAFIAGCLFTHNNLIGYCFGIRGYWLGYCVIENWCNFTHTHARTLIAHTLAQIEWVRWECTNKWLINNPKHERCVELC